MKKIRIGNDIRVLWSIFDAQGNPYNDIDKEKAKLYYTTFSNKVNIPDFKIINGNVIEWNFRGREQETLGEYILTLVVNDGEDGMITLDHSKAFRLVPRSSSTCEGEDECSKLATEVVMLTGQLALTAPGNGGATSKIYPPLVAHIENNEILLENAQPYIDAGCQPFFFRRIVKWQKSKDGMMPERDGSDINERYIKGWVCPHYRNSTGALVGGVPIKLEPSNIPPLLDLESEGKFVKKGHMVLFGKLDPGERLYFFTDDEPTADIRNILGVKTETVGYHHTITIPWELCYRPFKIEEHERIVEGGKEPYYDKEYYPWRTYDLGIGMGKIVEGVNPNKYCFTPADLVSNMVVVKIKTRISIPEHYLDAFLKIG